MGNEHDKTIQSSKRRQRKGRKGTQKRCNKQKTLNKIINLSPLITETKNAPIK